MHESRRIASGAHSNVQLDYLRRRKSRGCEIVGSEGTLTWHSDGKAPERCRVERAGPDGKVTVLASDDAYDANKMYIAMLDAFLDAAAGKLAARSADRRASPRGACGRLRRA